MNKNFSIFIIIGFLAILLTSCASEVQASPLLPELEPSITPSATEPSPEKVDKPVEATSLSYPIVDTGQIKCFNNTSATDCLAAGQAFSGQDAQYSSNQPQYVDNGDGTVTDLVTGLIWQQTPGEKVIFSEAVSGADSFNLASYDDWRLPTIKELYSLIDFSGLDPSGWNGTDTSTLVPFIDTDYFDFEYGDTSAGERIIDAQYWSSTEYVGTTMNGSATTFGVNFADGRIKGYGREYPGGGEMTQFVLYVRGNPDYDKNDFVDNSDATITDQATGLMWQQSDSGAGMVWEDALNYCESLGTAGYEDWRLPNAKELQSIVDYSRSPSTSSSPAIDPLFNTTAITDEAGDTNYPFYWSSTTHENMRNGSTAAYVTFGEALGYMNEAWIDVHGAGAQRSDPKTGDPDDWPEGHGPQGDAIRIYNYVRCVRAAEQPTPSEESEINLPIILGNSNSNTGPATTDYYLYAPLNSTSTYLINQTGETLKTWSSSYRPGNSVYLLENGNLLRTGNTGEGNLSAGGQGGIVEEIAPTGNVVWSFEYANNSYRQHHDIEPLPNGNLLLIAWELKTAAEASQAGRDPSLLSDAELWPDHLIEVDPSGNVVWEWHIWDHLIQDIDASKENYGVIAEHPELIDLNFTSPGPNGGGADWTHINAVDYNSAFDQILLTVHNFSEIWVIDHSTTTAEAAAHTGGNSGVGGDLLYRWGNPQAYNAGTSTDQVFFGQHDAQWIETGSPGEGNMLVFNNGTGRNYSSVDEFVPPVDGQGRYAQPSPGLAFAPASLTWTYTDETPTDFYADRISGMERLPDGNTLICDGPAGYVFEVNSAGKIIWETTVAEGQIFRMGYYPAGYTGLPASSDATSGSSPEQVITEPTGERPVNGDASKEGAKKIDFAAVAAKLGLTKQALREALGPPPLDLAAASQKLGITEEALIEALGIPVGGQGAKPPGQQP